MAVRLPLRVVGGAGMTVDFTASKTDPEIGEAITFTGTTSPAATEYAWDFGDGTFAYTQNPTKTYVVPGDYTVTLLAGNSTSGGVEEKTDYITAIAPPFVEDGLIFYVDAAENSSYPGSGTTWYDISGFDRDTTLVNGPTYSASNGGIIQFDGVDDRVLTANFNPNITTKTLVTWVKLNDVNQQGSGVLGAGYSGSGTFDAITYNEGDGNGWGFGSDGFARTFWTNVKETSSDTWVMITAVYQVGTNGYKMYRNDQLIGQGTESVLTLNQGDCIFYLGWRTLFAGTYFGPLNGSVGVGMIYNRALSAAEVEINFDYFKARYGY